MKAQFFGNAPCGFYKYKYPKNVQNDTGAVGAKVSSCKYNFKNLWIHKFYSLFKVFFYIARHKQGQLPAKDEFKWLDREELYKELPPSYRDKVAQFLIDED